MVWGWRPYTWFGAMGGLLCSVATALRWSVLSRQTYIMHAPGCTCLSASSAHTAGAIGQWAHTIEHHRATPATTAYVCVYSNQSCCSLLTCVPLLVPLKLACCSLTIYGLCPLLFCRWMPANSRLL